MDNPDRNLEKKVMLEDLLKLKKLERPDEAFWENFDKQLQHKILERLVCKPSILSQIPHFLGIICKPAISLSALALLMMGVVGNNYRSIVYSEPQIMIKGDILYGQENNLSKLASVKKNYIKSNIVTDGLNNNSHSSMSISPSSKGVRFSGNIDLPSLGKVVASNRIY